MPHRSKVHVHNVFRVCEQCTSLLNSPFSFSYLLIVDFNSVPMILSLMISGWVLLAGGIFGFSIFFVSVERNQNKRFVDGKTVVKGKGILLSLFLFVGGYELLSDHGKTSVLQHIFYGEETASKDRKFKENTQFNQQMSIKLAIEM